MHTSFVYNYIHVLRCALVLLGVLTSLCYAAAPSREEMSAEINISAEYEMTEEEYMPADINNMLAAKVDRIHNTDLSMYSSAFGTAGPFADCSQHQYQQFTDPLTQHTYTELESFSSMHEQPGHQRILDYHMQDTARFGRPTNAPAQAIHTTPQYDYVNQPDTSCQTDTAQEAALQTSEYNPNLMLIETQLPNQTAVLEDPVQATLVMKEKNGILIRAECCYGQDTKITYVFDASILSDPNNRCNGNRSIVCMILGDKDKYFSSYHKHFVFNSSMQKTDKPAQPSSASSSHSTETVFTTPGMPLRRAILNITLSLDDEQQDITAQLRKDHPNDSEVILLVKIENDLKSISEASAAGTHALSQQLCHKWTELMHTAPGSTPHARTDRIRRWIEDCVWDYDRYFKRQEKTPGFVERFRKLAEHTMLLQRTTLLRHTSKLIQIVDQFVDRLASGNARLLFRACREMTRLLEKSPKDLASSDTSYVVTNNLTDTMFDLSKTPNSSSLRYDLSQSPKVVFRGYISFCYKQSGEIVIDFSTINFCTNPSITLELFVVQKTHIAGCIMWSQNTLPPGLGFDIVRLLNPVVTTQSCGIIQSNCSGKATSAAAEDLEHSPAPAPLFFELALGARTLLEMSYHLFVAIVHMYNERHRLPAAIRTQTVVLHTSAIVYAKKTIKQCPGYSAFKQEVELFDSSQDNLVQLGMVHQLLERGSAFIDSRSRTFQYYFTLSRLLDLLTDPAIQWADQTALHCFVLAEHFRRPAEKLSQNGELAKTSSSKVPKEENLPIQEQESSLQPDIKNIKDWLARIHHVLVSQSRTETVPILVQQTATSFGVLNSCNANIARLVLLVIDASYDLAVTDQYQEYLNRDECRVVLSDSPHFEIRTTDQKILEAAKMYLLDLLVDNALVAASEPATSGTVLHQRAHPPPIQHKRTADSESEFSTNSTPFKKSYNR